MRPWPFALLQLIYLWVSGSKTAALLNRLCCGGVCFYRGKPGHLEKAYRKLKWDLERENKQEQAQDYERAFPVSLVIFQKLLR